MKENEFNLEKYKKHFRVTIFGSARIKSSHPLYREIFRLSEMIAAENIDIVTGGGPGLMNAANSGHQQGRINDTVISYGLNIKLPHEQKTNRHLDIKMEFERFSERLDNFMQLSNIVVVAPGGIGTLLELFYTWQLLQVKHKAFIPVILLGDMWQGLIEWIRNNPLRKRLIDPSDIDFLYLVNNGNDAMKIIRRFHEAFKKNGEGYSGSDLNEYRVTGTDAR